MVQKRFFDNTLTRRQAAQHGDDIDERRMIGDEDTTPERLGVLQSFDVKSFYGFENLHILHKKLETEAD
jgi:hypothetical protein